MRQRMNGKFSWWFIIHKSFNSRDHIGYAWLRDYTPIYIHDQYKATRSGILTYLHYNARPWHRRCARTLTQLLAVFYETNASMSLLELSLAPEGSTFRTRTCLFVTGNASNVQYQWICNLEMKVCVVSQLIRVFSTTVSFPNLYFPYNSGFC